MDTQVIIVGAGPVGLTLALDLAHRQLNIRLRGEGNLARLRQALYRCNELYDRLPLGPGPGKGRHYLTVDAHGSFLIMQDSRRHWTLHATAETDEEMRHRFEAVVGVTVRYEMLYCAEWRQNLLLADRYGVGRVFLAGDAVHLVIPAGGLGMNTGVGDGSIGPRRGPVPDCRTPGCPMAPPSRTVSLLQAIRWCG